MIRAGSDTEVLWNDARHLKPDPVYKRTVSGHYISMSCIYQCLLIMVLFLPLHVCVLLLALSVYVFSELQFWTESFVQWSPLGTYLATVHRQGAAVWGGSTSFNRLMRYAHPQVFLKFHYALLFDS